jgi:hypothetical protein
MCSVVPIVSSLRSVRPLESVDAVVASVMKVSVRTEGVSGNVEYRRDGLTVQLGSRHGATWIYVSSHGLEAGQRIAARLIQRGIPVDVA